MNERSVEWLLGRRFVADFTVLSVGDDPARTVTLLRHGPEPERWALSLEEFRTLLERGLLMERPYVPQGRPS